jgi:lipopolysaccharide transport system permease protein
MKFSNSSIKEIWDYRMIIPQLIILSFKTQFRQSILGPAWHILQPLASSGVLLVVFKEILGTADNLENPFLTFFSAVVFWNVFLQAFCSSCTLLEANQALFTKIYFPRVIPAFSQVGISAFRFLLQFVLYIFLLFITGEQVSDMNLFTIFFYSSVLFLHLSIIGIGIGLIFASASVAYKDLVIATPFLTNILFFASPVVYNLDSVSPKVLFWISFNPVAVPLQNAKNILLGSNFYMPDYWTSWIPTLLIFFIGFFVFQRASRTFADTI